MKLSFLIAVISIENAYSQISQGRQPSHFHMEDRGPEIQIKSTALGTVVNAIPAGLSVLAKPGTANLHVHHVHHQNSAPGVVLSHKTEPVHYADDPNVDFNHGIGYSYRGGEYGARHHGTTYGAPWLGPPQGGPDRPWEIPLPEELSPNPMGYLSSPIHPVSPNMMIAYPSHYAMRNHFHDDRYADDEEYDDDDDDDDDY